ncbi:hypothetical protein NDU88_002953 [Pleurodeles waltl]|uniref:Uncharacterized protein n=1 Tax=Pleurodeles waltl TaxID=8319 RepID=A0AAV7VC18_PLEWA|nr:hypothetical protein NDU88_002953 [Pleurodeles waltl]
MTELMLPRTPEVALLGYVKEIPSEYRRLVGILLVLAKHRVVMCWGWKQKPRCDDWLKKAAYCQEQLATNWELMPMGSHPREGDD